MNQEKHKKNASKTISNLQESYFSTFDLGCVSALVSLHFELISINKQNPRKAQFIFLSTTELEKAVNEYFSDRLLVNPRTYFDNIKMLKNRLYS